MSLEIKKDIYYVGALNPNLRIFDIIMKTEFGTTYNAYLIKGKKTALIETVHTRFFDNFLANIQEIIDVKNIDYVVLNHTEPDHSGSLKTLIEKNPDITIVSSRAGNMYLKSITNREINGLIVKDGDVIDLGGKTLKFINAPFLHWPDSMFTYVEEDGVLFTCDVLGCHYCEPYILDTKIAYEDCYNEAFKYYYEAIFSPFKQHVISGLDKIRDLKFDMVCPSHGPVLTEKIETSISKYREWSLETKKDSSKLKVYIPYVSAYGCTEKMACELKKAIQESDNIEVEMVDVIYEDISKIKENIEKADGILIGSPTINRDALKPIWDVLSVIEVNKNQGKLCGVFGSYGWSGEAVKMIIERAKGLRLKVYGEGIRSNFVPSEEELNDVYEYGKGFAAELFKKN
jgi:flavorubredoxin